MGTAQSSPARAGPPPRLDEDDAFAIATHWRDQLLNCVWLDTHDAYSREPVAFADAQRSVFRHFEWVTFSVARFTAQSRESTASAARDSAIVWLALTHCKGFSGRENPRFWKRVFSALWTAHHHEPREIADEVGFFEHPERPFPCVRVVATQDQEEKWLSAFFRSGSTDPELRRVLKRLEPYLSSCQWRCRDIPVEIVGVELYRIKQYLPEIFLPEPQRRPSHKRKSPTLRLVAVRTSALRHTLSTEAFLTIQSRFQDVAVHIPVCRIEAAREKSVLLIEHESRHEKQTLRVETIVPRLPAFPAVCSALPHTRIVTALMVQDDNGVTEMDDFLAAWLGYALFHPNTAATSSLRALSLCVSYYRPNAVDVLSYMAMGNNLLFAMGQATTLSSAYHEARLAASTNVHADGSSTSRVVYLCPSELTVTLCIASVNQLDGASWVRVVVPGIGLGWVKRNRIGTVVSRPPGISVLRRLELTREGPWHIFRPQTLPPRLFSLLGASLTHLKVETKFPTQELQAALLCCPNLKALRIHGDGTVWSDATAVLLAPPTPRLQTLELLISDQLYPVVAPQLNELTCLRVIDSTRRAWSSYDQGELLSTLKRCPRLSHVYWSGLNCHPQPWWETSGYLPWWKPSVNSDMRNWQTTSTKLLGTAVTGALGFVSVPLPVYARLAFLSTFSANESRPLPHLSPDVVGLIFAFASMSKPRQILIRYD